MANTDPTHWFLPDSDITPFRTPGFSSGNEVTALVDGKKYFDHLAARFDAITGADYYYFTAWRANGSMKLRPDVANSRTYKEWLEHLRSLGVEVKGMLWYVPTSYLSVIGLAMGHAPENIAVVNDLVAAGGGAVLDHRVPSYIVSHHQKSAVMSSGGEHWAYVGGIDVAPDRWDTIEHNHDDDNPQVRPKELFSGWHDVHSAIRGPAVAQVWENFQQRWNDPTKPHDTSSVPGGSTPTPISAAVKPTPAAVGNQHVQLLRTLACKGTYSFLKDGEQTVRLAYERAIDLAEHYIYIEDQYLWPCTLVKKLNAAAKRGVKVIFVTSHEYDAKALVMVHNDMRHDIFLDEVRAGAEANVFVFHLQRPSDGTDIYVHSKLMIVDDCYAAVGSANISLRSHTSESELHIAVVDATSVPGQMNGTPVTVCDFAKNLRMELWTEHLGVSAATIDDRSSASRAGRPAAGRSIMPSSIRRRRGSYARPA